MMSLYMSPALTYIGLVYFSLSCPSHATVVHPIRLGLRHKKKKDPARLLVGLKQGEGMKFYDLIVQTSHIKFVHVSMRASALSPVIKRSRPRKTDLALLHSGKNNTCIFILAPEIQFQFFIKFNLSRFMLFEQPADILLIFGIKKN